MMIHLDGSVGEGGGQILRTALGLSLVTGKPFRIEKIRAGRAKPGLLRQHLTAVEAAAAVGRARVEGATIGSRELTFEPSGVNPGAYEFAVGTAGSATLVLQTVLPALLAASGPSTVVVEGGTHNPFAPPFDFLDRAFLPLVNRMGPTVTATLERWGFFPAGGGRISLSVQPAPLKPIDLLERGEVRSKRALAVVSRLPRTIAERELARLDIEGEAVEVESAGPGNAVIVEITTDALSEVFTGFGEKGRSAEAVADGVAREVRAYLASGAPVGPHLADQFMIPLAMAGGGAYRTISLTPHARTNREIVSRFLDVQLEAAEDRSGVVVRART